MAETPANSSSDSWRIVVEARRGRTISPPGTSYIFRFYEADEVSEVISTWQQYASDFGADFDQLRQLYPFGHFCCGDFVCNDPSGELFVVIHDDFGSWHSDVSFTEFIERLDAGDISVEEDIYSRTRPA